MKWPSKYRDLAESLSEQLAGSNEQLREERQRRIAAEALSEERKSENERMAQSLTNSEAARERALTALDTINAKLLQAVVPQAEPAWRKQSEGEKPNAAVPVVTRRAKQPDEATKLMMKYITMQAEQLKMRKANALAANVRVGQVTN